MTRDEILGVKDLTQIKVSVPEWSVAGSNGDAHVYVRAMTGAERDAFEEARLRQKGAEGSFLGFRAHLVVATVCDEGGMLLFSPADVVILGGKSSAALDRIVDVAMRVNRIGESEVKELEKN